MYMWQQVCDNAVLYDKQDKNLLIVAFEFLFYSFICNNTFFNMFLIDFVHYWHLYQLLYTFNHNTNCTSCIMHKTNIRNYTLLAHSIPI